MPDLLKLNFELFQAGWGFSATGGSLVSGFR